MHRGFHAPSIALQQSRLLMAINNPTAQAQHV